MAFNPEKPIIETQPNLEKSTQDLETDQKSIIEEDQHQEAFEVLDDLKRQEEAVSTPENNPKANRLKKTILGLTAGLILFNALPGFARAANEKPTEKQKIEMEMQKLQQQLDNIKQQESQESLDNFIKERNRNLEIPASQEVQEWLDSYFDIEGLKIGKPVKSGTPRCCEFYGIYIKNKELGTVISEFDNIFSRAFSKEEFLEKVKNLLERKKIKIKIKEILKEQGDPSYLKIPSEEFEKQIKEKADFKVSINSKAKEIFAKWGAKIEGNVFHSSSKEETLFDDNTKRLEFFGVNNNTLILTIFDKEETGGRISVVTYIDGKAVNVKELPSQKK